jgi:hypothetical protein
MEVMKDKEGMASRNTGYNGSWNRCSLELRILQPVRSL